MMLWKFPQLVNFVPYHNGRLGLSILQQFRFQSFQHFVDIRSLVAILCQTCATDIYHGNSHTLTKSF